MSDFTPAPERKLLCYKKRSYPRRLDARQRTEISGSPHHHCAFEGLGTMKNPDDSTGCVNECVGDKTPSPDTPPVTKDKINYKLIVGKRIKLLRQELELSQEVLAERCGIYRTYLSRIESGSANPTLLVLVALADSLDVAPSQLLMDL
jgi:DNA-binding XRE family transcriptional regulator